MTTAVFASNTPNTPQPTNREFSPIQMPPDQENGDKRWLLLREVMAEFKIGARDLCRRTAFLEQQRPGLQRVQPDQLSRYLCGKQDLYSRTVYTIELALPPIARQVYRAKILLNEGEISQAESLKTA